MKARRKNGNCYFLEAASHAPAPHPVTHEKGGSKTRQLIAKAVGA
jgi:hypothetical protein